MRIARTLSWVVGGVLAVMVLFLLTLKLFVNPNSYKARIEATVKSATGRDLVLNGDLKLSVFPWIALELGPATLSSPPGFGTAPFLAFQRAAVRVKLLPLLGKRLEVARVELDGLNLNLEKNAAGQGNWSSGKAATAPAPESAGAAPELKSIEGIAVTHGHVKYGAYTIDNLTLETGAFTAGKTVPVRLGLDANRGVAGEALNVNGRFDFRLSAQDALHVAALNLNGTISAPGGEPPVHWEIAAPTLDADLAQQTLALPTLNASLSSARLGLALNGTRIMDDPHLSGSLTLSPVVLREFAPRVGVALPATHDPKALASLAASLKFTYDAGGATLDDVLVKLDDTTLKGRIQLVNGGAQGAPATLKFALGADAIDLDRYRPPAGRAGAAQPAQAAAVSQTAKDAGPPMAVQGTMVLAAAHVAGLDFTNFKTTLDSSNRVARLYPTAASLYGGSFSGDISYDQRAAVPALTLDVHLANIDATQLVANTSVKGRVSGKANVNLKASAKGAEADDITQSLNGHFDLNVANGALEGVDLGYAVAAGEALLNQQSGPTTPNAHKTAFDTFRMSAPIVNGVATTDDLAISSAVLKVTGKGSIALPSSGIDMTLLVKVMKSAQTTAVDIPLKVTGTYTDPTIRPDLNDAAKGALKQKLQDVLKKNGLEGLFKH